MNNPVLLPANILLPKEGVDLGKWAVLACDQFTSQPEYWHQVESLVGAAPSTLHITLPEVYLEAPDVQSRIDAIHKAMEDYRQNIFTQHPTGYVYIERVLADGTVRQGLVGMVDLEDYSYLPGTSPRIRPSENTVVERIPPRLAVRRGAPVETPHILMLADDPSLSVIEPLAAQKRRMTPLYNQQLMLEGGSVRAWAVWDDALRRDIEQAMAALDDEAIFCARYGTQPGEGIFALAVGDGNHSLATAKALWEETRPTLSPARQQNHPARFCLVELENIQSPAIQIEPIHRVVFGDHLDSFGTAFSAFAGRRGARLSEGSGGGQPFTLLGDGLAKHLVFENPPHPLAVATLEEFLAEYLPQNPGLRVDYVHGEEAVRQLATGNAVGILLPPFEKSDLFRGIALGGVLPKKTFSMGTATEKRYYMECRQIVP